MMTNLHFILQISNNSLTIVRSVEVPIIALIVKPGTSLENNRILEEILITLEANSPIDVKEPEGSDDYTEVTYDKEQCLSDHYTAHVTPPAYTPSIPFLATMEPTDTLLIGDEVISTIPAREEDFDINSPLGEYVVDFLMENMDVAGLPRHLVKQLFNHLIKNLSLTKGMSDEPLGDDSKPISYDVTFLNPLFDFNDAFTLCNDNSLFDEEFEDISSLDLPELTPVIDESTLLVTLPLPCTDVLGDAIIDIDLILGEHLDTLSTRDKEINFKPSRDIEELERLLADDPVPVPIVFDEPLGNSDSMSRSSETSDLFEELIAEFGLDDSIPIEIDDRYHDSEESSSLYLLLPDPKQICLRELERFDSFFSLTQSGGKTRVIETPSFGFHQMPSPRPAAYLPKEVMYCYYHPQLTSGDGFDHGPKMK
ncbi:hypothetical protein Tco_1081349 [Tanacetum coccineum]|uniref:Reverse transcriptase domain-containing protein n=1 Tax=Tanacetum coccineum TaxID=301880 RepID=A0ABQ5HYL0_9ASTR